MKTAIIMTGHVRTWDLIKDQQIDILTSIYGKNIDWFVSVWETKTVSKDYISEYFNEKINLINLNWIPCFYKKFNFSGIAYSTYLREISSLDKKKHEFSTGKIYERVVFTRPDILLFVNSLYKAIVNENEFAQLNPTYSGKLDFALQLRGDFNDIAYPISTPSASDIRSIGGFLSSDILGMMFIDFYGDNAHKFKQLKLRNSVDIHSMTSIYVKNHSITVDNRASHGFLQSFIRPQVVRPTMNINEIFKKYKNWDLQDNFEPGFCPLWRSTPTDYKNKINACIEKNIDLSDYDLENFL